MDRMLRFLSKRFWTIQTILSLILFLLLHDVSVGKVFQRDIRLRADTENRIIEKRSFLSRINCLLMSLPFHIYGKPSPSIIPGCGETSGYSYSENEKTKADAEPDSPSYGYSGLVSSPRKVPQKSEIMINSRRPYLYYPDTWCYRQQCTVNSDCCQRYSVCLGNMCVPCLRSDPCRTEADCCKNYPYCVKRDLHSNIVSDWSGVCVDEERYFND